MFLFFCNSIVQVQQNGLRNLTPPQIQDYVQRIEQMLDSSDIFCDWPSYDLRTLGVQVSDVIPVQGQLIEEVPFAYECVICV